MDNNDSDDVSILINSTYLLKYSKFRYQEDFSRYIYKIEMTVEAFNLHPDAPSRSIDLSQSYSMSYTYPDLVVYEEKANQIKLELVKTKDLIVNLLSEPLEHMPMYINDPEPFNKLAAWRLTLPKDHTQTRPLTTL